MKKFAYLAFAVVAFASCKEQGFQKGTEGMEYKIIADGKGDAVKAGETLEIEFTTAISKGGKDSILSSTKDAGMPQIVPYDSAQLPPAYFKLFGKLKKGDSLVTRIITDSVFKKQPESMPPFMKKGDFLYTYIRVTNIYKTAQEAESAQAEMAKTKNAALSGQDDKTLNDYFKKNNIKAVKTTAGAYVQILQPGTGAMLDTSVVAKVNYTGRSLDGVEFDSNTDPSKGHVEPLLVNLTSDPSIGTSVIPGLADGLKTLSKGAKAKVYIPSGLGYGRAGAGGNIKPNTNLVFEVEVLDVLSKQQAVAEKDAQQKIMQEMQKRYMDSVSKTQPAAQQQQQQPATSPR